MLFITKSVHARGVIVDIQVTKDKSNSVSVCHELAT